MVTPSTNMNSMMKFLDLIYSPEFGQMTGTFDPLTIAQSNDTPLARSYMNSSNEDVARIFSGLVAGEYDPITAKQELAGLSLGNLETAPLYSAVDKVFNEVNASSKGGSTKKGDKYQQAGLPNPLASYSDTPEAAPMGKVAGERINQAAAKQAMLKQALKQSKTTGPNIGEGLPSWMQASLANTSADYIDAAQADLKKRANYEGLVQDAFLQGNAARLDQSGATPFNDMLIKRALLAKQMFGQ
jgi:hypothetical protein